MLCGYDVQMNTTPWCSLVLLGCRFIEIKSTCYLFMCVFFYLSLLCYDLLRKLIK